MACAGVLSRQIHRRGRLQPGLLLKDRRLAVALPQGFDANSEAADAKCAG